MRIVQVTESLEPGGAERIVVDLSNALAERHQVSVVCVRRKGELAGQLAPGIGVHCLEKGSGNEPGAPLRLARVLRERRAEAIHVHHWGVFLDAVIAGLIARVPVMIHTAHGHYMPYGPGSFTALKKGLRHFLERRSMAYCRRIVCVSEPLVEYIAQETGIRRSQLVVIPNGLAVSTAARRASDPAAGEAGRFVYVTVGRLAAVKNFPMMIAAFAAAAGARPGLQLEIVGDGPERAALEAQAAAAHLSDRIHFHGFRPDVQDVLAGADAFVLSSLSEGTPMAVLEAMRARLPVIATRVGGLPQTVLDGQTGLLVDSGDVAALTDAMLSLANAPQRARALGEAGSQRVAEAFSMSAMVSRYESLFHAAH